MARLLGFLAGDPHERWVRLGVIGRVERSHSGNVVIAAGTAQMDRGRVNGWVKDVHIVLDPSEALELIGRIQGQLDQTDPESGIE